MLSSHEALSSKIKEKSIKGKRIMKKGGKTKVEVTHLPQFLPPTFIHPNVSTSLIIKGKRIMKKGGKTKVEVTHLPQFLPPTFTHPNVSTSLIITTSEPMALGFETPLSQSTSSLFTRHLPLEGCTLDMSFPLRVENT